MEEVISKEAVANINMDRISQLPVPIIQQILSLLDSKESAHTSFLSKSLLYAWCTRPVLEFRIACLNDKSMKYVIKSLRFYHKENESIHKFKLHIKGPEDEVSRLHVLNAAQKWLFLVIKFALCKGIVELDLSTDYFGFPFQDKGLKWCNLKKLKLEYLPIDDHTFSYLISSCPLLTHLHLEGCRGLTKIAALKLPNLREFYLNCEMHWIEEVHISAPKLESFKSTHVGVVNIDEGISLKSLSLSYSAMGETELRSLLSWCPFLEDLSLNWCHEIRRLVISSHSIKLLRLNECHSLATVDIDAPNLKLLEYKSIYKINYLPFVISRSARKADCCSITYWCMNNSWHANNTSWLKKDSFLRQCGTLRELMTNFRSSTLTVQSSTGELLHNVDMSSNKGLHNFYMPSYKWLHNVNKSLWYDDRALQPIHEHELESLTLEYDVINEAELEGFLQMCRPKYVICKYGDNIDNHDIMRTLCFQLQSISRGVREIIEYCDCMSRRSRPLNCRYWKHYIKEARICYEVGNEHKPLSNYKLLTSSKAAMIGKVKISFALEWREAPNMS